MKAEKLSHLISYNRSDLNLASFLSCQVNQMLVAEEVIEVFHTVLGHASDSYCNLMVQLAPTELSFGPVVLLVCAPFAP